MAWGLRLTERKRKGRAEEKGREQAECLHSLGTLIHPDVGKQLHAPVPDVSRQPQAPAFTALSYSLCVACPT